MKLNPTIKAQMRKLLEDENLAELKRRITIELQGASKVAAQDWLTLGIWAELVARRLYSSPTPPPELLKSVQPKDYLEWNATTRELLLSAAGRPLTDLERLALGRTCGRVLARYTQWRDHFGLRSMLVDVRLVPEAVEASFPGYLAAGMLGFLIRERLSL